MIKYKPTLIHKEEVVVDNFDDAITIAKILMKNGNVVMLSEEEGLTIINYIWTDGCDRNNVAFMPRDDFEIYYREIESDDDDGDGEDEDSVVSMD